MVPMTNEEFKIGNDIIWNPSLGDKVTCNLEISEKLAKDLSESGIVVSRVGRKHRSRHKFIVFEIEVIRIVGLEMMFLSEEEAQDWHRSKNRSLKTLMKAPDEAFEPVKTEKGTEMLYWSQAYRLAFRNGSIKYAKEDILKQKGVMFGKKYGI